MEFLDLVKNTVTRRHLNKLVEINKIKRCLEAARIAPSVINA